VRIQRRRLLDEACDLNAGEDAPAEYLVDHEEENDGFK
jgi:hypothetical protein